MLQNPTLVEFTFLAAIGRRAGATSLGGGHHQGIFKRRLKGLPDMQRSSALRELSGKAGN